MKHCDLIVIGGGPAGMAAAYAAKRCGISTVLIIERREYLGGILPQCIHDGFGLALYETSLTGPEYTAKWKDCVNAQEIEQELSSTALTITPKKGDGWIITTLNPEKGFHKTHASAVIIATGCREKTLAQLRIPGSRPAGIYTAGCAQYMMNMKNYLPGKSAVILGFGDIGLIMARRMTLEGIQVKMILGQLATGLMRNMVQCVQDFQIPTRYGWTVVSVHGHDRVKGVTIAPVDALGAAHMNEKEYIPCDTLLIAAGLIPELELLRDSTLISDTQSQLLPDANLCIEKNGIFACGNVIKVHDLVDSVTCEGERAGISAATWLLHHPIIPADLQAAFHITIHEPKWVAPIHSLDGSDSESKNLTCILCPTGCQIKVESSSIAASCAADLHISDFACERGKSYAITECLSPKRTVTTNVRLLNGCRCLLPVRTDRPISKELIGEVMKIARKCRYSAPVQMGNIIIENIANSGANLISCDEIFTEPKEEFTDA